MSQYSVFCIAPSRGRADRIVHGLKEAGFPNADISALFLAQDAGAARAAGRTASSATSAGGVGSAGAIRGVMSWIAGVGRVVIPGSDPLIAAGPMAAVLNGATVGGVAGGLIDFGLPPVEARRYEGRIREGAVLLSLQSANPDQSDRAREIFTAEGAEHICTLTNLSTVPSAGRDAGGVLRRTAAAR